MIRKLKNLFIASCYGILIPISVSAQQEIPLARLYEQASEVSGLVVQYGQDTRAIEYFYGPMSSAGSGRWGMSSANSPEQRERILKLDKEYLDKLDGLDFDAMSVHGQVDYVLLKRKIEANI